MSIKERVQTDFVAAMKAKNETAKAALSGLKSKITEAEKANGNRELTDVEVIKVITSAIKQRKQSFEEFNKGNREDLAMKEYGEMLVLEAYMPKQITDEEITAEISKILVNFEGETNRVAKMGRTMGAFNKAFTGKADNAKVKSIIESIVK